MRSRDRDAVSFVYDSGDIGAARSITLLLSRIFFNELDLRMPWDAAEILLTPLCFGLVFAAAAWMSFALLIMLAASNKLDLEEPKCERDMSRFRGVGATLFGGDDDGPGLPAFL